MFENVVGLVVEYNPFHNGHLHHINEINKLFQNNIKIAEYLWFGLSGLKISNLQYFLKLHFLFYLKLFPDKIS